MTEESEEIKLPINRWHLTFETHMHLESAFRNSSSRIAMKKMKMMVEIYISLTIIFLSYHLAFYLLDNRNGNLNSKTLSLRVRYWVITRHPILIFFYILDYFLSKFKFFHKFRGGLINIVLLYMIADTIIYIRPTEKDISFGTYAIFVYIHLLWSSDRVAYNWISFAIGLLLGHILMFTVIIIYLGFFKSLDTLLVLAFFVFVLIVFSITAETQKRKEYFILNSVKMREMELKKVISTLPVGIAIVSMEDESHDHELKYSNIALMKMLEEEEPEVGEYLGSRELDSIDSMNEVIEEPKNPVQNFIYKLYSDWKLQLRVTEEENININMENINMENIKIDRKEMSYKLEGGKVLNLKVETMDIIFQNSRCTGVIIEDLTLMKRMERDRLSTEFQNRLVRTISHEIRTPLNAIHGSIEIVENSINSEIVKKNEIYFRSMKNGIEFLLYFIGGMLNLSKSQDQVPLELRPFDLYEMVEDVVSLFRIEIERKTKVKLVTNIYNDTPKIILHDKKAITQLIFSLLANSVKYTFKGKIIILIKYDYMSENLVIIISDTGIGISEEQQKHLFQLYGKALNSEFGTGIGLTLCKKIVESMEGNIQLESEKYIGTKITINFPCKVPTEESVPNLETEFSSEREGEILDMFNYRSMKVTPSRRSYDDLKSIINSVPRERNVQVNANKEQKSITTQIISNEEMYMDSNVCQTGRCSCPKILVVDDVFSNILVVRGLLGLIGLEVDDARNGIEALEKIRAAKITRKCCGNYQMVLMDCSMPLMDGYDATGNIVRLVQDSIINPCIVVGLTAYDSTENKQLCIDAGMNDVLFKPISRLMLINLLIKYPILTDLAT